MKGLLKAFAAGEDIHQGNRCGSISEFRWIK
jgi:hypothetical protein